VHKWITENKDHLINQTKRGESFDSLVLELKKQFRYEFLGAHTYFALFPHFEEHASEEDKTKMEEMLKIYNMCEKVFLFAYGCTFILGK